MTDKPAITPELAARGFLSEAQVRKTLNVSDVTLRQWRHLGQGPRYFKIGRSVYYRSDDIDAWLEQQAVVPKPKEAASQEALRPWDEVGLSRATWFRRGRPRPEQAGA